MKYAEQTTVSSERRIGKMKSVLISIQPKWCELIASGKKTIEVRKTAPKEVPFKAYIYQTKKKWIYRLLEKLGLYRGKVIGEFVCDKVMRFTKWGGWLSGIENYDISFDHLKATCLDGLWEYGKGKPLYGWHISDLKIYDKPKELGEFKGLCRQSCLNCKYVKYFDNTCEERGTYKITRPPQSWCYVEGWKNV